MKVTYPSSIVRTSSTVCFNDAGDLDSREVLQWGPQWLDTDTTVETPSLFRERPLGNGNVVCHVKATAVNLVLDNGQPVLWGTRRMNRDESQTSTTTPGIQTVTIYKKKGYTIQLQVIVSRDKYRSNWASVRILVDCYRAESHTTYPIRVTEAFWVNCTNQILDGKVTQSLSYAYCSRSDAEAFRDLCKDIVYITEASYPLSIERCKMYTQLVQDLWTVDFTEYQVRYLWYNLNSVGKVSARLPSGSLSSALLYSEEDLFFGSGIGQPFSAYHLKALEQESYLDALDHVPQLNENSLSNVLELVSFIKALVVDHRVEIPSSLSSAWLAYRYSYTTTKLDYREAVNFMHRSVNLDDLGKGFSCYGKAYSLMKDVPVTVKCRLSMKSKELGYLDKIWTALYTYGLSPSFYVVWDMIPYSFIVDWFIPVGDILSGYDKTHMYDRAYDISDIWFSVSYDNVTDEDIPCHAYTRWFREELPEFNGYYTLENKGTPSNKVIGFRILDALSLIFK